MGGAAPTFMTITKKIALAAGVVVLVLVVAVQLVVQLAPPRLIKVLEQEVAGRTDGLYGLQVGGWSVDILQGNIELRDVRIRADTARFQQLRLRLRDRGQLYDVDVPRLSLRSINMYQVLVRRRFVLSALVINQPRVRVVLQPLADTAAVADTARADTSAAQNPLEVYQYISNVLDVVQVDELRLVDGQVSLEARGDTAARLEVPHVSIVFTDVRIDSTTRADPDRFLYARRFLCEVRDYYVETPDSFYTITAHRLVVDSDPGTVVLDSLRMRPRYGRYEHGSRAGVEKDRYVLELPQLRIDSLDMKRLLRRRELYAATVRLSEMKLDIFRDKRLPLPHDYKPLPAEALRKLPLEVNLQRLQLENAALVYEEFGPQSSAAGALLLGEIDATIAGITNNAALLAAGAVMRARVRGKLMGDALLTSEINFRLDDPAGSFTASGTLSPFDLRKMNPITEQRAFVHIESGQVNKLSYQLEGDNKLARGQVNFLYEDLRVSLINKNSGDTTGLGVALASLLGNALVLKNSNPSGPGRDPRAGHIYYARDQEKSFFNYWWKSLFSGVKDAVGMVDPRPDKRTFWEWLGIGTKEEKDD